MKKVLFYIQISLLLAIVSGCSKALIEDPKTVVKPDAFFKTATSYEQAVIGIYSTIPSTLGSNSWTIRESFSDIIGPVSGAYEQGLPTWQNNHQPFFYNVRDQWGNHYRIIKDANFVISKIDESAILSDAQKKALSGEARLLRGYAYFQLVQLFGDIPLRTELLKDFSNDQVQVPKSPQADVYKFIVDDLTFAEANMSETSPAVNRLNKWVAAALLAKVYLTMAGNPLNQTQYYTNARDKALAVINSGKYTLLDDYSKVFHNTSYTTESIWEQTYQTGVGGNSLMQNSLPATGYAYIVAPATWFINSFSPGDQRKVWGIKENYVWGTTPPVTLTPFFTKFVDLSLVDKGVTSSGAGILAYTIPVLRLGEMYLIAAEAENEVNGPANAYQYINKIRWRARVNKSDATHVPDLAGLGKAQFRDSVLMERKHELYLEGSTWYDLKRTNTLSRIQTIRGATLVHPIGAYNNTWYIPDVEIQNNNIAQNPLYQ